VVKYRLKSEYDVEVLLEGVACTCARWVTRRGGAAVDMDDLRRARVGIPVEDVRGRPVLLFESEWHVGNAPKHLPPDYELTETAHGIVVRS
jgi:peptide chain release factor 3